MSTKTQPILPGAMVGVLGSGQLGRMFAIAAKRMGYRVATLSPEKDSPTGQVADLEIVADYHDLDAVEKFARQVRVVTFEFENVPSAVAECAAQHTICRPAGSVLHITQNRNREKSFLRDNGFPVTPFAVVETDAQLQSAIQTLGAPGVLKTADSGYDGKGQVKILRVQDAAPAWESLNKKPAVLEAFVDFACEVSVVAARGLDGSFAHFGVCENRHANHILDVTIAPGNVSKKVAKQAEEVARGILEKLDVVGVLCVEFFVTKNDEVMVNELAPRPHNSGHHTFDACVTSQFEQQLRAICGLPLGSAALLQPAAAMANLLGDVWFPGGPKSAQIEPDWSAALASGDVKLHLYGKASPRWARKMGHLTAMANTADEAVKKVVSARSRLMRQST